MSRDREANFGFGWAWATGSNNRESLHSCHTHLPDKILFQVMTPKQHSPLEAATLQLQVLPLPPEQVGLLLRLEVLDVLLLLGQPLLLLLLGSTLVLIQLLE